MRDERRRPGVSLYARRPVSDYLSPEPHLKRVEAPTTLTDERKRVHAAIERPLGGEEHVLGDVNNPARLISTGGRRCRQARAVRVVQRAAATGAQVVMGVPRAARRD